MKIAIDTNVLVRLISNDNKILVTKSKNLIKKYSTKEIFISYGVIWKTIVFSKVFTQKKLISF